MEDEIVGKQKKTYGFGVALFKSRCVQKWKKSEIFAKSC